MAFVLVIGHHCQQETLRIGKDTEDQKLQGTAIVKEIDFSRETGPPASWGHWLWNSRGHRGEVAEEKYMGVQLGIHSNQGLSFQGLPEDR